MVGKAETCGTSALLGKFLTSPDDLAVASYSVLGRIVGQYRVGAPAAVDEIIFRTSTLSGVDVIPPAPTVEAV